MLLAALGWLAPATDSLALELREDPATDPHAGPVDGRASISAPWTGSGSRPPRARTWISVDVAGSSYAMTDLNDAIRKANAEAGSGVAQQREVLSGFGLGGTLGAELGSGVGLGIGVDRLYGRSGAGGPSEDFSMELSAYGLRVFGSLPISRTNAGSVFVGGSMGVLVATGWVRSEVAGVGRYQADLDGDGPLLELFLGADLALYPSAGLEFNAGYRHARVDYVTLGDLEWWDLDYSGVFARTGLRLRLAGLP